MLRNTLALMIGIAAAGLIAAPIASADSSNLTNIDVAKSDTPKTVVWQPIKPAKVDFATGYHFEYPLMPLQDKDCNLVRGSWSAGVFTPGTGKELAWTNDGGKTLKKHPYKTGCNNC